MLSAGAVGLVALLTVFTSPVSQAGEGGYEHDEIWTRKSRGEEQILRR